MSLTSNSDGSSISEKLAAFAAGFKLEDVPQAVRVRARHGILDAVGVALASSTLDFAMKTVTALGRFEGGDREVIGFRSRLGLRDAVVANGAMVHGIDFDDTHLVGVIHPTASCFPTAMGVAAALDASGSALLASYILAVEAAARIGAVAKGELNQIGFHPTGVVAAFATALGAGYLYGLDRQQMVMAQGIALSMASGTREYSADGAWTKRLHPGWAGAAGITAAVLAKGGFSGPRLAYEGRFGLFPTHLGPDASRYDLSLATAGLGTDWEVAQVALKPLPACQLSIASIDAALAIVRQHAIAPQSVARIVALVPPHAVNIVCEPAAAKRRPQSAYAAQFSLPFCIAAALIRGRFGLVETEMFADPAILALADKVEYQVDPASDYPRHFSGEVRVMLADGRQFSDRQSINRGSADNPMTEAEICEKFLANAELALPRAQAMEVMDAVLALGHDASARELAARLSAGGRDAAA